MTENMLKIMIRAVKIRLERGEKLEAILDSYPKLSETEKVMVREKISSF